VDTQSCANQNQKSSNKPETKGKEAKSRAFVESEIQRRIGAEKQSLEQVAAALEISLTTVRRVCRTLKLGRYSPDALKKGAASKSSQPPFGWDVEHGVLKKKPAEMRWVKLARAMRAKGESFNSIARHFQGRAVPTKNGGRWHARTVIQILNFNSTHKKPKGSN